MVNSVIGGFQKIPKNKRYNPEEDYNSKSKKKNKHNINCDDKSDNLK